MKILLVDDDKTGRTTTVTDISSVYGFEVTSCSDTYTAKKHLSKNEFCLVIIDLYLPEYTNSEVSTDAGIKLIQYIFETNDNIIRPQGILVLSKNLKEIEYYNQLLYYPVAVIILLRKMIGNQRFTTEYRIMLIYIIISILQLLLL